MKSFPGHLAARHLREARGGRDGGPGEPWPVRVDAHLEAGLDEADVDRWVPTASVLHSNGDGYRFAVKDGRIAGVRGDPEDRIHHGRLDPKDLFGRQAKRSPDRLTRPLVRDGGALPGTSSPAPA